jgi:hypothetical protein
MILDDANISKGAGVARLPVTFHKDDVAISQADAKVAAFKPGFAFEIVGVQHFAAGVVAAASYVVKIGATAAISATTPAAGARGDATLAAAVSGGAGSEINLHVTTDGTGTLTDLTVVVLIRPTATR